MILDDRESWELESANSHVVPTPIVPVTKLRPQTLTSWALTEARQEASQFGFEDHRVLAGCPSL